jgi:hypothetical protein
VLAVAVGPEERPGEAGDVDVVTDDGRGEDAEQRRVCRPPGRPPPLLTRLRRGGRVSRVRGVIAGTWPAVGGAVERFDWRRGALGTARDTGREGERTRREDLTTTHDPRSRPLGKVSSG